MKNYLYTLLLCCCYTFALAQNKTAIDELKEQKQKCVSIMNTFDGRPESLKALIDAGNKGLKMTRTQDHEFRYVFDIAIGTGFYYQQDFKQTQYYFEQAYEEAIKANLLEKSLKPLGNLLPIYHYLGLQAKADSCAQKLKHIADGNDTLKTRANVYYNLGVYNQQQKFYYSIALNNFLKAVQYQKPIADTTKILKLKLDYGSMLMMVAEVYLYMKQPNKAIEYLEEVKPYLNISKIFDISTYGKFIRSYALLNNKKEALKYYNLLHLAASDGIGNWSELVSSSIEMAGLETKAGNFAQAKAYLDKADKQAKKDNKEILTSSVNYAYGEYYKTIKDYPMAIKYYRLAEHGAKTYNKEQYADLLKSLTLVEILQGDQSSAKTHFDEYVLLSDSLNQSKISLNLAEMEAKYQNSHKTAQIKMNNLALSDAKKQRVWLFSGLFLLSFVVMLLFVIYNNKKKTAFILDRKNAELDLANEHLAQANHTKTKLFSIISHDLRSPVSQLFTFLKLQQTNPNVLSEENKQQHQQKLIQSAKQLLATMEDLLIWSKSQMEHFELDVTNVNVPGLFVDAITLMQNQADAKNVEIKIGEQALATLESDENLLTIVLRNLLQNAINNAFPHTTVVLSAGFNAQGNPLIAVSNKGDMIPPEKIAELLANNQIGSKSSGYGLLIVKELLLKINAQLHIESNDKSTTMQVVFNS